MQNGRSTDGNNEDGPDWPVPWAPGREGIYPFLVEQIDDKSGRLRDSEMHLPDHFDTLGYGAITVPPGAPDWSEDGPSELD